MSKFNALFALLCTLIIAFPLFSQENDLLRDNNYLFESGQSYFDAHLFGLSLHEFESSDVTDKAVSYQALSSYEIQENRSVDILLESIARGISDKAKNETYNIIGDRYFQQKNYKLASDFYKKINKASWPTDDQNALAFKLGYCEITDKQFDNALGHFRSVTNGDIKNDAVYYQGICEYYLNKKEEAVKSFERIENDRAYQNLVPFYLAQIYFKDADYDKAISYAESRGNSKNKLLTDRILGMSYLAKNDFDRALPFLNDYADNADKLTENEFYQIGILNYKLGKIEESLTYFKELSHQNTELGQLSNFLVGSSSLKLNNKKDAQSAFKQASKLNFHPNIKTESEFLYYKLSAEQGEERIAVNGLSKLNNASPYYTEAQNLLSQLLLRAEDKQTAMRTIENLPSKNADVLNTYKKLSFNQAMQDIEDDNYISAIDNLNTSLETPGDNELSNKSHFWLGQSYFENGDIDNSFKSLNVYLSNPDKEYQFESQYLVAYHEIERKEYDESMASLEAAIQSFDPNTDDKNLFDDAIVRLADLELVRNNYQAAIEYYDLAIQNKAVESDYILYQKALIYGVNNQTIEKLTTLEDLVKNYPASKYRDDAFFEIGETLIALGKNNEAYQIYNSVIIEFGDKSEFTALAYMRKGLISYNQGDLYAALDAYKQGIKLTTDKDEKRRALIAVEEIYLNELNDPDAYFEFTEQETGYKINDITRDSISYNVALSSYKDNLYEKAISQFESYTNKYNTGFYLIDAYYYLGESFVVLKSYDKALLNYEKVLNQINSSYYKSALEKSALIAYNHKQDFDKSFNYYNELIEMTDQVNIEYLEAALYSAFKTNNTNGILTYGELLTGQKDVDKSSMSTAHFYLAKTYERENNTERAMSAYQKVVELSENNQAAESSFIVAQMLFDKGDLEASEKQAFDTTSKAANYPIWVARSLVLLGDIYSQKKDFLNASAAYESVIENFKDNPEIVNSTQLKLDALNKLIESESRIQQNVATDFMENDTIK